MNDTNWNILNEKISNFVETRKFSEKDTPKNLAIALSIEAAELLEIFQWLNNGDRNEISEKDFTSVQNEIGDVFIYLIALSNKLGIDLCKSAINKMILNEEKYPKIN